MVNFQVCQSCLYCLHKLWLFGLLVKDGRLLDSLRHIDTVKTPLFAQFAGQAGIRPVDGLVVDHLAQFQQEFLARQVVEPVNHHQVVASPVGPPMGPVVQGGLGQLLQLVPEIVQHQPGNPFIPGSSIILLQKFQHHHLRPPIFCIVALQPWLGTPVGNRTKIAIRLLAVQRPFYPGFDFVYKHLILQNIGQREQSIDPVGAPLPHIAIPSQPAVPLAHHCFIDLVEMTRHPVLLAHQLILQPSFGGNRSQRQLQVGLGKKGGTVV